MDKPTINLLSLLLLLISLSSFNSQANQAPIEQPLNANFPLFDSFLTVKGQQAPNVTIDTSEPIEEVYPKPVRVYIEQTTVAENIFSWFYSMKELHLYDLKHPEQNNTAKQLLKRIYQLSDQQLAILQTHALKAINEIENLHIKDKEHKCQQFSQTYKKSRQQAINDFIKNARKTPVRDEYLHQTYQQITKQITHLDGLIAKIHQTNERTIEDHTPEDFDWLQEISQYCNASYSN